MKLIDVRTGARLGHYLGRFGNRIYQEKVTQPLDLVFTWRSSGGAVKEKELSLAAGPEGADAQSVRGGRNPVFACVAMLGDFDAENVHSGPLHKKAPMSCCGGPPYDIGLF